MSAELGQWCLALALAVALLQATLPLAGAARGIAGWMRIGADAARAQALLLGLAFACLASAFLANDFSLRYVVAHSNSALPAVYRFAAVWGGHEGSLLLWALMLSRRCSRSTSNGCGRCWSPGAHPWCRRNSRRGCWRCWA